MLHPTIGVHLIIFSAAPILINLLSLIPLLRLKKGRRLSDSASLLPLLLLIFTDIALSALLLIPIYGLVVQDAPFGSLSCRFYGAADMAFSLFEIALATSIAFDRYIVTKSPKWGTWRSNGNYAKLLLFLFCLCVLWSLVPWAGYGSYATFNDNVFCSLDWRQAEMGFLSDAGPESKDATHKYIAFLTATFLLFFLIPVCIAGSFYYSVIEHVDSLNSIESREENGNQPSEVCTWAPSNHVAKVGLGCLLASTLPFMAYSIVCLNPFKSDFQQLHVVVTPVVLARCSALLNPLFYVWLNPEVVAIEEKLLKKLSAAKRRPPPSKNSYNVVGHLADLPTMSMPMFVPSVPRRQLPQIPAHLLSPRPSPTPSHGTHYHFGNTLHPGAANV